MIRDHLTTHGYSPTIREIGDAIGVRSPNAVAGHLVALRSRGLIDWQDGRSRTIRVLDPPGEDAA